MGEMAEEIVRRGREIANLRAELRHLRIKRNAMFLHATERLDLQAHALEHVQACEHTTCEDCRRLVADALTRAPDGSFLFREDLDDAIDALEMMVGQYLFGDPKVGYDHSFMSAGEEATAVLCRLRPDDWELTVTGMKPATPREHDPHTQAMFDRMDKSEPFDPDWTIAPGEILADWAREQGLSANRAADRIGLTLQEYLALVCGERVITRELADTLELGTGMTARIWLRLEASFRMGLAMGKTWQLSQASEEADEDSDQIQ